MSEINANDTVSIKLMSGEEIVARFIEHDNDCLLYTSDAADE